MLSILIDQKQYSTLFFTLIYNSARAINRTIPPISTVYCQKDININYAIKGRDIVSKLEFKYNKSEILGKEMEMIGMGIQQCTHTAFEEKLLKCQSTAN